ELVKLLEHPNWWHRTTAQRLLLTTKGAEGGVSTFAGETQSPDGLILAAWLLESKGKLPESVCKRMVLNTHPRVRDNAARLVGRRNAAPADFTRLARDADPRVRFQTALSIGSVKPEARVPILVEIAVQDAADRWTRMAVECSTSDTASR